MKSIIYFSQSRKILRVLLIHRLKPIGPRSHELKT
ncbi:mCG1039131, isoform CRA_b [Mus musculus]|nr:mCG1039131, isoform CRA_b [Mus musculus]